MKFEEFVMKVQAISKTGQLFTSDPFARENYEILEKLSQEILSDDLLDEPIDHNIFTRDIYPTPNVSVRTMVFNENNQLLMVQESDGDWALPGGWCDVFESPSENAAKEVFEESGLEVEIERILAVFFRDKYKRTIKTLISEYSLYFAGKVTGGYLRPNHETIDARFFDLDALPPLSHKNSDIEIVRALRAHETGRVEFD